MLFFHLLLFNPPASNLIGQSQQVMLPFYWSNETHVYNIINIVWAQQLMGWADGVPSEEWASFRDMDRCLLDASLYYFCSSVQLGRGLGMPHDSPGEARKCCMGKGCV